jgi:serine kinase of HPr protein (carbohydrate metabolism regulator)
MSAERAILVSNVSCIAIEGRALILDGVPGAGKSSLALALIDRGAILIGDDGIALEPKNGRAFASPPPAIAGKLEVRGVGILEFPTTSAPLALRLNLSDAAERTAELTIGHWNGFEIPSLEFPMQGINHALRAELALSSHGIS